MSDDQFKDLKNYLDERFDKQDAHIDERFSQQDARIDERFSQQDAHIDERFDKQDAHIDERFDKQDAHIDERFSEQDAHIDERSEKQEVSLKDYLNLELAKFTGQLIHHLDQRIDGLRTELKGDIGRVQQSVDNLAKRVQDDEAERAAMIRQIDRHERWHHQAADHLGLKLDYE